MGICVYNIASDLFLKKIEFGGIVRIFVGPFKQKLGVLTVKRSSKFLVSVKRSTKLCSPCKLENELKPLHFTFLDLISKVIARSRISTALIYFDIRKMSNYVPTYRKISFEVEYKNV